MQRALAATGHSVHLEIIQTTGDREQTRPLSTIGGKGLFTRGLDRALLEGRIDLAVHSLKDLPTDLEPGLVLAAVPEREDPRDVLVGPREKGAVTLQGLPRDARVGTSSLRRRALIFAFRPDLEVQHVRGNLDTRIAKVDRRECDAIIVAAAGMRRLGLWTRVSQALERTAWLPAPGQGALGLISRRDDLPTQQILRELDHPPSRVAVRAERALLAALGGGCQTPIAALGLPFDSGLRLWALVASPDGTQLVRADGTGSLAEPEALGASVAELLDQRGAGDVLKAIPEAGVPPLSHP